MSDKKFEERISRKSGNYEEIRHTYNTGDKTKVEVTVKLKRRKSKPREVEPDESEGIRHPQKTARSQHKTGSWADLLKSKDNMEERKENNASVKSKKSEKDLLRDVQDFRKDIKNKVREELERRSPQKPTRVEKGTSTRKSLAPPEVQMDLGGGGDFIDSRQQQQQQKNDEDMTNYERRIKDLEEENLFLRQEAGKLMREAEEMSAKQNEYKSTIKGLYQVAELLKNENQQLLDKQLNYRLIKERFADTLNENEQLKGRLEYLLSQIPDQAPVKDDQILKFKSTIKDVRKTIAAEIESIRNQSFSLQNDPRVSSEIQQFLHLSRSDLNSTSSSSTSLNANEVNQIMFKNKAEQDKQGSSSSDDVTRKRGRNDSTQYMTVNDK